MATCITLINDALYSIGVTSDINPSTPELINASFRRLIQWVNMGLENGIDFGFADPPVFPVEVGDELGNNPAYDLSISAALSPWLAPLFNVPVSVVAGAAARVAMQTLNGASMLPDVPEWPETLPLGGGNMRGPWNRVFFPVPVAYFIPVDEEDEVTP